MQLNRPNLSQTLADTHSHLEQLQCSKHLVAYLLNWSVEIFFTHEIACASRLVFPDHFKFDENNCKNFFFLFSINFGLFFPPQFQDLMACVASNTGSYLRLPGAVKKLLKNHLNYGLNFSVSFECQQTWNALSCCHIHCHPHSQLGSIPRAAKSSDRNPKESVHASNINGSARISGESSLP